MKNYSRNLNMMLKAAEKSYNILQRDHREIELLQSSSNGSEKFSVQSLNKVSSIVKETLSKISGINFICNIEEFDKNPQNNGFCYGIDGFRNFARSTPNFSLTIAYINELGETESGLIFCPSLLEYYVVEIKNGAWKESIHGSGNNEMRLKISKRSEFSQLYIGSSACQLPKIPSSFINNLLILNCESLSIAYLAAGKIDIYYLSNSIFFRRLSELFAKETYGFVKADNENFVTASSEQVLAKIGQICS